MVVVIFTVLVAVDLSCFFLSPLPCYCCHCCYLQCCCCLCYHELGHCLLLPLHFFLWFFLLICLLFLFRCCIVIWAVEVHLLPYCLVAFVLKFNQGALPPRCLPLELLHLLQDPQGVGLWSRQQQSLWPGGKKHKEGRRNTEHISGVPRPGKGEE